jgi:hypothetical protein
MDIEPDLEVAQALKHFKSSMDAWSDHAMNRPGLSRPRTAAKLAARPAAGWRLAASWALGCAVVMGSLASAVHVFAHRQEMARIAAQKAAEQRAAAAQGTTQPASAEPVSAQSDKKTPAATVRKVSATQDSVQARDSARGQDEDLLASVDSDVSRAVPAAMEPLAQLMDDNGTQ